MLRVFTVRHFMGGFEIKINRINNYVERRYICNSVLRTLPEWFGIDESIKEYNDGVRKGEFFVAYDLSGDSDKYLNKDNSNEGLDKIIGFMSLTFNNKYTAEVYVTGVLKEYHNMGVGKSLLNEGERFLKEKGYKFIMVKTLGNSHPDKYYADTREFYLKTGFTPLQEIKEIWGKENPCLIMVKNI